jgi:hypothetical protein
MIVNSSDKQDETRRGFVRTGAAAVTGLCGAGLMAQSSETLALRGGPKSVTVPPARQATLTRWPQYGDAEKQTILSLLDKTNWYPEIPAFEKELKEYLDVPFTKAFSSGTCAIMVHVFRAGSAAGQRDPGTLLYGLGHYQRRCTCLRYVPAFVDIKSPHHDVRPGGCQEADDRPDQGHLPHALLRQPVRTWTRSAISPRRRVDCA